MSTLDSLKRQAKSLKKVLPSWAEEQVGEVGLVACQDLIAIVNGYPNWAEALSKPHALQMGQAARRLEKLMPGVLASSPKKVWSLSTCQEVIAKAHGFASYHDAVREDDMASSKAQMTETGHVVAGLELRVLSEQASWLSSKHAAEVDTKDGRIECVRFGAKDAAGLEEATDKLDAYMGVDLFSLSKVTVGDRALA